MVRNVAGPGHAPRRRRGRARVRRAGRHDDRPGIDFDAKLRHQPRLERRASTTRRAAPGCGAARTARRPVDQWVHQELRGLASRRIQALPALHRARAAGATCAARLHRPARRARAPRRPRAAAARRACAAGSRARASWLRGVQDVAFDAADASGIRRARVELDGARDPRRRARRATSRARCRARTRPAARDVRHPHVGRRRAPAAARRAGRGRELDLDRARRARRQHAAARAGAGRWPAAPGWRPERTRTVTHPAPAGPGGAARPRAGAELPRRRRVRRHAARRWAHAPAARSRP